VRKGLREMRSTQIRKVCPGRATLALIAQENVKPACCYKVELNQFDNKCKQRKIDTRIERAIPVSRILVSKYR
jgi:hypothetical protein